MSKQYVVGIVILLLVDAWRPEAMAADGPSVEARLAELEAREDIRTLMKQYGRTLDTRQFEAFGQLFTEDGVYVTGGQPLEGPKAIAESMRAVFAENRLGIKEPNFHVFFNEVISVTGPAEATAFSQSAYVVPGEGNAPEMLLFASYEDVFVKRDGEWKFKSRTVRGEIPSRGQ